VGKAKVGSVEDVDDGVAAGAPGVVAAGTGMVEAARAPMFESMPPRPVALACRPPMPLAGTAPLAMAASPALGVWTTGALMPVRWYTRLPMNTIAGCVGSAAGNATAARLVLKSRTARTPLAVLLTILGGPGAIGSFDGITLTSTTIVATTPPLLPTRAAARMTRLVIACYSPRLHALVAMTATPTATMAMTRLMARG